MKNFALIGAAGYIAPRHMRAIRDTGNRLIAAMDPNDSVGIIDSYFPEADFFTEFERFDRHLEKLKRDGHQIDFLSICSPNYLHDAHIRLGLRLGANVICEKPVVLNPWNVDALTELEKEYPGKIYNILQLRLHDQVIQLKKQIDTHPERRHKVKLQYYTSRGNWYQISWKGDLSKSGGIATNIGVHFFDMLTWIFGPVIQSHVETHDATFAKGQLSLEKADVEWVLSIDYNQIPKEIRDEGKRTFRSITVDDRELDLTQGFENLHTRSYEQIINGEGYGIEETKNVIQLVHDIRQHHSNRQ